MSCRAPSGVVAARYAAERTWPAFSRNAARLLSRQRDRMVPISSHQKASSKRWAKARLRHRATRPLSEAQSSAHHDASFFAA
jgi:hypothetical protein